MLWRISVRFTIAILFVAGSAWANDTSVGGTGVDLFSVQESSIRMKAEDISLTYEGGNWLIVARYTFENPTDQPVTLQVGFPEIGCPKESEGDCHSKPFVGLKTEVDGRAVAHRKGSLAKTERWADHLGTFWLFDVTFPPKKEVKVVHRYSMDSTIDSMGTSSVSYVTRTGSTWAGPIGHAKFTYRVPPHAVHLRSSDVLGAPKDPHFVQEGEGGYTEIVFEKANWVPEGDLDFGFATPFSTYPVPRLTEEVLLERSKALGLAANELCPRIFAFGTEELESEAQAQSCRNLIYARWGYPFEKKVLHQLFYEGGKPWHTSADYGPLVLERDPAPLPAFRMEWIPLSERRILQETRIAGAPVPAAPEPVLPEKPSTKPSDIIPQAGKETYSPLPTAPPLKPPSPGPSGEKREQMFSCGYSRAGSGAVYWIMALVLAAFVRQCASRQRAGRQRAGR